MRRDEHHVQDSGYGCLREAEEALKGTLAARGVRRGGLVTSETGYMTGGHLSNGDGGNADDDLGQTRDTRPSVGTPGSRIWSSLSGNI